MSGLCTGLACVSVGLAGCGGSHHAATTTGAHASTPAQASTAATSTLPTTPSVTTGTGPLPPTGPGPTTTRPASTPAPRPSLPRGARIPATFTIKGELATPSIVNVPALVPIALTLVSADGRAHQALVRTSPSHTLTVTPGGRASLLLPGQRDGRYVILLDRGAGVAQLLVGGEPGP